MTKKPAGNPHQKKIDFSELDPVIGISQEILIGRMIDAWSTLEAVLEDLIWVMFSLDMEYGRIITKRLDANGRITALRQLAKLKLKGEKFTVFCATLNMIEVARIERNFATHGVWSRHNGIPHVTSTKLNADPFTVVTESFPEQRMDTLIDNIRKCSKEIMDLSTELRPLPPKQL